MKQTKDNLDKALYRHLGLFGAPASSQLDTSRERIRQRLGSQAETSLDKTIPGMDRTKLAGTTWRWSLLAAASVIAAVLFSGNLLRNMDTLASVESADSSLYRVSGDTLTAVHAGDKIRAGQILRSNRKTGGVIALEDGSHMEMHSESEVLLERANDGLRVRLRDGGIIVNAAKQGAGHLYVQTKDVMVSVLGTVFLVNAEEEGSRVAVIDGEVNVRQGASTTKLIRGEQVATNPLMEPQLVKEEISWSRNAEAHLALLQPTSGGTAQIQAGSITGTVRSASGSLVPGVRVTALRSDSTDAALRAMASLTETDATGRYRLENIPPGNYYITAGRIDLPTYYPGTLEMTKGSVVSITSAANVSGIDFVLRETSTPLPSTAIQGGSERIRLRRVSIGPALPAVPTTGGAVVGTTLAANNERYLLQVTGRVLSGNGLPGWWTDEDFVKRLGLTDEQRRKIGDAAQPYLQVFAQNQFDLDKEEAALKRMVSPDSKELPSVASQEDRVLQLRREREAANAKITLEISQILTDAQNAQLKAEQPSQLGERRQRLGIPVVNPTVPSPDGK